MCSMGSMPRLGTARIASDTRVWLLGSGGWHRRGRRRGWEEHRPDWVDLGAVGEPGGGEAATDAVDAEVRADLDGVTEEVGEAPVECAAGGHALSGGEAASWDVGGDGVGA